jgi:hypothetical protein
MNKMSNVLDDNWQQSQDKHSPLQQSDVEEPRRSTNKRSRSVSPSPSAYGDDDNYQSDNGRAKSHKTAQTTGREISDVEDDCISVYANDDQDNISVLIQDNAEETDTVSPDDTLKCLGEKFEEIEATCGNIKPQLAEIVQKRWHKKLSAEKLTFLQEKCMRPENCPEVRSMSVNPEIWAKLPHFQQQSDKNVSNIQGKRL